MQIKSIVKNVSVCGDLGLRLTAIQRNRATISFEHRILKCIL